MTRQEFIDQYPTPEYVTKALDMMNQNNNALTVSLWEISCRMARREADAAFEKYLAGEDA